MPSNFTDKNGANMAGHSDKWSDKNRRSNSHDAGGGSRGSRNQGTGIQGKANTLPSHDVDTSKMNPEEKLKYFKALGLLKPDQGLSHDRPEREKAFSIESFGAELRDFFKHDPKHISAIVNELKETPKEHFKAVAHTAFRAFHEAKEKTENPAEVYAYIEKAIHSEKSQFGY